MHEANIPNRLQRPKSLRGIQKPLRKTTILFVTLFGGIFAFKQWHMQYLRCGTPEEEWQYYDKQYRESEDERWNIDRKSYKGSFYDLWFVKKVRNYLGLENSK